MELHVWGIWCRVPLFALKTQHCLFSKLPQINSLPIQPRNPVLFLIRWQWQTDNIFLTKKEKFVGSEFTQLLETDNIRFEQVCEFTPNNSLWEKLQNTPDPHHRPSNFLNAAPPNFNRKYLACRCHISNFESDFFLRERNFIIPCPTRRPIAKN